LFAPHIPSEHCGIGSYVQEVVLACPPNVVNTPGFP
jgi:hypothetical protein